MGKENRNIQGKRLVAGVAIAAAFTGVSVVPVVAPELAAQAEAAVYQDYEYTDMGTYIQLDRLSPDGKAKVQANGGVLPDFPLEINGKKVTTIGDRAFSSNRLTQLPDWGNITTIDEGAFSHNQLSQIPDSWGSITTIGNHAFAGNQLTALPESWGKMNSIGFEAFRDNQIQSLEAPLDLVQSVDRAVFFQNSLNPETIPVSEKYSKNNYFNSNSYYLTVPVKPGETVSSKAFMMSNPEQSANGIWRKFTFDDIPPEWQLQFNADAGAYGEFGTIIATAPRNARPGDVIEVPVSIKYATANNTFRTIARFVVMDLDVTRIDAGYNSTAVKPGGSASSKQTVPDTTGSHYAIDDSKMPSGWVATIDRNTGLVTAYAPSNAAPGTEVFVPVNVLHSNNTTQAIDVPFRVVADGSDAQKYNPKGQNLTVELNAKPGASEGISNKNDLPQGTKYEWVKAPDTSTPGDKPATVKVIYPDGSSEEVQITVKVNDLPDAQKYNPQGNDFTTGLNTKPNPGQGISNKNDLPQGTTFEWVKVPDTSSTGCLDHVNGSGVVAFW